MTREPQFKFFENVRIMTADATKSHMNGQVGTILGRTASDDGEVWLYAVSLKPQGRVSSFFEGELETTGEYSNAAEFFDGSSIRVRVDEKGRGTIAVDEGEIDKEK